VVITSVFRSSGTTSVTALIKDDKNSYTSSTNNIEPFYVVGDDAGNIKARIASDIDLDDVWAAAVEITGDLIMEGSTADDYEATFTVTDPTADRTYTFPDASGTVSLVASDVTDVWDCSTGDCNTMTIGESEYLDGGAVDGTTDPYIALPRGNDCSGIATDGSICWDSDDNRLYVGDGSAPPTEIEAGSPAVQDEVYGPGWNGDTTNGPSQNSVFDYLIQLDTDSDGDVDSFDATAFLAAELDPTVDTADEIEAILTNDAMDFGTGSVSATAMDAGDGNVTNVGQIDVDTVDADGAALALGDGDETVAINSSDWDIGVTGDMTGIGAITADGTIEGATITEGGDPVYSETELVAAYQPLEATLTDIADGTIVENLVNTDNPWADNEVADTLTVDASSTVDSAALDPTGPA
jgi:hypothetical protein